MVDAEAEPGPPRSRRAVPLTVPVLLALSVWGLAPWHRPDGPQPPPGPSRVDPGSLAWELRRFRTLTEPGERVRAIARLDPIRDPRVTVALVEVVQAELGKDWTGATSEPPVLRAA